MEHLPFCGQALHQRTPSSTLVPRLYPYVHWMVTFSQSIGRIVACSFNLNLEVTRVVIIQIQESNSTPCSFRYLQLRKSLSKLAWVGKVQRATCGVNFPWKEKKRKIGIVVYQGAKSNQYTNNLFQIIQCILAQIWKFLQLSYEVIYSKTIKFLS